jgi:hypothetical protein
LQLISNTVAGNLATAGLSAVQMIGNPSVAQAKVLLGANSNLRAHFTFASGTTISDRAVSLTDANALNWDGRKVCQWHGTDSKFN